MTAYVAGFLFDEDRERVALVRKNRPGWQAGKLNGVGGHIELGESALEAMGREFYEEAGVDINSWQQYAVVRGPWGRVHFFRATATATQFGQVRSMTDEPIEIHYVDAANPYSVDILPNLRFLLPLALYTHDMYDLVNFDEVSP